jgi:hypothetical protein
MAIETPEQTAQRMADEKAVLERAKQMREIEARRAMAAQAAQAAQGAPQAAQAAMPDARNTVMQKLTGSVKDGARMMGGALDKVARGFGVVQAGTGTYGLATDGLTANNVDNTFMGAATAVNPVVGMVGNALTKGRDALIEKVYDMSPLAKENREKEAALRSYGIDPATGKKLAAGNQAAATPLQVLAQPPANQMRAAQPAQAGYAAGYGAQPMPQGAMPAAYPTQPQGRINPSQLPPIPMDGSGPVPPIPSRQAAMANLAQPYQPGMEGAYNRQMAEALGNQTITQDDAERIMAMRRKPNANEYLYGGEGVSPNAFRIGKGQGFIAVGGENGAPIKSVTTFGGLPVSGGYSYEGSNLDGLRKNPQFAQQENNAKAAYTEKQKRKAVANYLAGKPTEDDGQYLDLNDQAGIATIQKAKASAAVDNAKANAQNRLSDLYGQHDAISNELRGLEELPSEQRMLHLKRLNELQRNLSDTSNKISRLETGKSATKAGDKFEVRETGGGFDAGGNPIPKRLVKIDPKTGQVTELKPPDDPAALASKINGLYEQHKTLNDKNDPSGMLRATIPEQIAVLRAKADESTLGGFSRDQRAAEIQQAIKTFNDKTDPGGVMRASLQAQLKQLQGSGGTGGAPNNSGSAPIVGRSPDGKPVYRGADGKLYTD